jgi:hypothetical protein
MDREKFAKIVAAIANIAVLFGLALVAYELRQNTLQLKVQLEWQVNQKIFENNQDLLGEDPTPIFAKSITNPEELTYIEFHVASAYLLNLLNVWEDMYFMYEEGLIDKSEWQRPIDEEIRITLGNRFAQAFWKSTRNIYEPELAEYIDERLPEVDQNQSYQWYLDTMDELSKTSDGNDP